MQPQPSDTDQNNNSDQAELDKFGEIAHQWWDKKSEFKPLHDINPIRLHYIEQATPLAGLNVLDIGCGGGILSESMADAGATVTGIDLSDSAISVARLHAAECGRKIDYQCVSSSAYSEAHAGEFDIVTCMEMLEHVPDPAAIVRDCSKLLKADGVAYFSTLNRNNKSYAFAIIGAEYVLKLLPKGTHDWKKFIKPAELGAWCRENHLILEDLKGMTYNPLTKQYKTGNDISVNYMARTKKSA